MLRKELRNEKKGLQKRSRGEKRSSNAPRTVIYSTAQYSTAPYGTVR